MVRHCRSGVLVHGIIQHQLNLFFVACGIRTSVLKLLIRVGETLNRLLIKVLSSLVLMAGFQVDQVAAEFYDGQIVLRKLRKVERACPS